MVRAWRKDGEVHTLPAPAQIDSELNLDVCPVVAVILDETSSNALSDMLLRCVVTQLASNDSAQFACWYEGDDLLSCDDLLRHVAALCFIGEAYV